VGSASDARPGPDGGGMSDSMIFHVSVTLESLERRIDDVVRAGFHPEVRMTDIEHLLGVRQADLARLGRMIAERSCSVFTHGPYLGLDIASLNGYLARHSAECLLRGLDVTAALGARVMVMHTNYSPFYSRGGLREWLANWSARMPAVLDAARSRAITIAIENAWEESPNVLEHMIELLPDGAARACIDVGHVTAFSRLSLERWWDVLGDRVVAVHLHDNDGLSDDHMPPGSGIVDFPQIVRLIRLRRSRPLMTLEVDLPAALEGRRYLERLFGEPPSKGG
jgi:sugar phosphate isomerase/epimerase